MPSRSASGVATALAVLTMMLLGAPSTALAGGDEQQAPPSAGPPGPWDGPSGKKAPYRPTGTRRCRIHRVPDAGPGRARRLLYLLGQGGARRRTGLALDIRGVGRPQYQFLAFPAEEPPSIECNEDAGQELIDN